MWGCLAPKCLLTLERIAVIYFAGELSLLVNFIVLVFEVVVAGMANETFLLLKTLNLLFQNLSSIKCFADLFCCTLYKFTITFIGMWTLKFQTWLAFAFCAAVSQNYDNNQRTWRKETNKMAQNVLILFLRHDFLNLLG